ncbi:glycosyltransferase 87 family protein [Streptomyces sp. NPDC020141]|uniref:glycosyltransferase 87 family protein n=1 Tax=Streptomyces sp. NPDC020141 TaxID=3365065 RepID=UPI0037A968F8
MNTDRRIGLRTVRRFCTDPMDPMDLSDPSAPTGVVEAPVGPPGTAAAGAGPYGEPRGGPRAPVLPRAPAAPREPRPWNALGWSACSAAALLLSLLSSLPPHRFWGGCAAVGYALAALLAHRAHRAAALVAAAGTVLVPLTILAARGVSQLEVDVVERSGELLLGTGSPYVAEPLDRPDYNPYLPGMALFGLPRALLGPTPLADARWWFALVFLLALAASARVAARPSPGRSPSSGPRTARALLCAAAFPAVALPLAVGGVDLPVIGLMCLGLALAARGSSGRAGLAVGAAAALKWTAWPALPVVAVLLYATRGRRSALRAAAAAAGVLLVTAVPIALAGPRAFAEHLVRYPLGEGRASSPAASPLPGQLLAAHVPYGSALAVGALAVAAAALAYSLVRRPPLTLLAAADRLALGLAVAMCAAPATRFGYLVYPLVLFAWFRLAAARRPDGPEPPPAHAPTIRPRTTSGRHRVPHSDRHQ